MITIIRDYETKAINDLIDEWEHKNLCLSKDGREQLFDKLFLCLKEYGILPKVDGIKVNEV